MFSHRGNARAGAPPPEAQQSAEFQGAFDRDSIPWAFGRLAEQALRLAFSAPSARQRYQAWLRDEAPRYETEASLQLSGTETFRLLARSARGEFVLVVEEPNFCLVLAFVVELSEGEEQLELEAVCVAHFDGDRFAALRWANALHHKLARKLLNASARGALLGPWRAAAPAQC